MKNFHQLTLHPDNAKQLKALILDLAVRGKLTQQWRQENPDTPNAQILLNNIKAEKQRLIAEKKIRKGKPLPPIEVNDIPFDIPNNWVWCQLGEITTIKGGKRIPKGFTFSEFPTEHIYIRVTDMKNGTIISNKLKYISSEIYSKINNYTISKDDLYITIAGTIGDVGIVPIKFHNMNLTENAAKIIFTHTNKIFLKTFLQANLCKHQFLAKVKKMAQPKLALKRINTTKFPLPPLPEQKAIVKIVSDLFQSIDALVTKTQERIAIQSDYVRAILRQLEIGDTAQVWQQLVPQFPTFFNTVASVKALRQTILQLAVQGKLTQQWRQANPDTPSATELLQQIKAEKQRLIAAKTIKKEKALPPIDSAAIPFELPEGWVWCRFQSIIKDLRYGTSKKCGYNLGNTLILRIPNISKGKLKLTDIKSTDFSTKEKKDLKLNIGDLLIIRSNGSSNLVGRSAVVTVNGYSFAGYLVRIRNFYDKIDTNFQHLVLESPYLRKAIVVPLRTTSGVKNINSTEISRLPFPLPPLSEQKAIVAQVETLLSYCDTLEAAIVQQGERAADLMKGRIREVLEG